MGNKMKWCAGFLLAVLFSCQQFIHVHTTCVTSPGDPCTSSEQSVNLKESIFYLACPRQLFIEDGNFRYARIPSPASNTSVKFEQNGPGIKVSAASGVSMTVIMKFMNLYEQISILPRTLLENHYVVTPTQHCADFLASTLYIIGTTDNTLVSVTNLADVKQTSFALNDLQSKEISSIHKEPAARILSSQPVAVFLYTYFENCTAFCSGFRRKVLVNQLLPTTLYGHIFIVPKIPQREHIKIIVTSIDSWASVTIISTNVTECNQTIKCEFYHEYICRSQLVLIKTDIPSTVTVYTVADVTNLPNAKDSFVTTIPDIAKYRNKYSFTIPEPLTYIDIPTVNTILLVVYDKEEIKLRLKGPTGIKILAPSNRDRLQSHCVSESNAVGYMQFTIRNTGKFELYEENGLAFGAMLHYSDESPDVGEFGYWLGYDDTRRRQPETTCGTQFTRKATISKLTITNPTNGKLTPPQSTTGVTNREGTTRGRPVSGGSETNGGAASQFETPYGGELSIEETAATGGTSAALNEFCICEESRSDENIEGPWKVFGIVMATMIVLTWTSCCCCVIKIKGCKRKKERVDPYGFPSPPANTSHKQTRIENKLYLRYSKEASDNTMAKFAEA